MERIPSNVNNKLVMKIFYFTKLILFNKYILVYKISRILLNYDSLTLSTV